MTSSPATPAPGKAVRIGYWVATAIVVLMMLFSAYSYVTAPEAVAGFRTMGFPDWFRIELASAKLLGAIVLLVPLHTTSWGRRLKEWAYAGFFINFLSAIIAHVNLGDGNWPGAAVFLVLLLVSYTLYQRLHPIRVA